MAPAEDMALCFVHLITCYGGGWVEHSLTPKKCARCCAEMLPQFKYSHDTISKENKQLKGQAYAPPWVLGLPWLATAPQGSFQSATV